MVKKNSWLILYKVEFILSSELFYKIVLYLHLYYVNINANLYFKLILIKNRGNSAKKSKINIFLPLDKPVKILYNNTSSKGEEIC